MNVRILYSVAKSAPMTNATTLEPPLSGPGLGDQVWGTRFGGRMSEIVRITEMYTRLLENCLICYLDMYTEIEEPTACTVLLVLGCTQLVRILADFLSKLLASTELVNAGYL